MKKLLISLGLLISFVSNAQIFVPRSGLAVTAQDYRLAAKLNFYPPHTRGLTLNGGLDTLGALIYDDSSAHYWMRDTIPSGGHKWSEILKSGDASGADSSIFLTIYRNDTAKQNIRNVLNTKIGLTNISGVPPIVYNNSTGQFSCPTCYTGLGGITQANGDILAGPGSGNVTFTLPNINPNTGSFGSASAAVVYTANAKGQITSSSSVAILIGESQVSGLVGDLAARQTLLSNNGSGFRVFNPALPGIKTLFCVGCTLDSTTNAGALTINVTATGTTPAGSNTQIQYNNSGAFGATSNFIFNSGSNSLCVGCAANNNTGSLTLGGTTGLGIVTSNGGPLQFFGDSILLKTTPIGAVTVNTNNIDRFRVQNNGTAFFYSLSLSSDTSANKPLYINTTTHEIGQLNRWPGSGGGGTQTLTYSQAATADTVGISGGNKVALLTATSSLAGLLDTSRAKYIDSLKTGLKKDTIHVLYSTGTGLPTVFGDGVTNNLYNWKLKQGSNITLTANADTTITISSSVLSNPMTTPQDMIVGGTAGAPTRLAVGANTQILTVVAGVVTWANPTSAVNSVAASNASLTISPTSGSVLASLNVANSNSWSVLQTFTSLTASSTVTFTGTTNPGNTLGSKFQVVGQDTTTGIIYHRQAQFLDTTGLNNTNGWIPYWDVTAQGWKVEAPPATAAPPNIGSGFRIYSPQVPGLRTLFCSGCTIDSTTNTNGLTITATGGGTPGGSNTQVQFNNSGSFGGSANLTWSGTVLSTTGLTATGVVTFNGGVTYSNGGASFDVIVQDTATGKLWRQPYYQFDTTGYASGNTVVIYNGTKLLLGTSGTVNLATSVTGVLPGANGGTGVANTGKTITIGGNLTTSGAFTTSFTVTANTSVTLPTSGTLYGTASGSITSANLATSLSDETGTGSVVFSASPAFTGTPTAPTATVGTNTTQIATTAFVLANSGVNTVGTFSGSSIANGASISSQTITFGPADGTNPGMVSTGAQTWAGVKTFTGTPIFPAPTTSTASIHMTLAGVSPTSPSSGDLWGDYTIPGLFYQPLGAAKPLNLLQEGVESNATSLTLDNGYNNIMFWGSSAASWTLPAGLSFQTVKYTIKNRGSANITLSRSGSDVIYLNSQNPVTSITIKTGDCVTIFSTGGGNWSASYSSISSFQLAEGFVSSQTAANNNFVSYTLGATFAGQFRIGGYVNVTTISVDVLQLQVSYTDETGTARTVAFVSQGQTSANISSTGPSQFPTMDIRCAASSTINISAVLITGTGSINYNAEGNITQIK